MPGQHSCLSAGRVEALEDVGEVLWGDPGTVVGDLDHGAVVVAGGVHGDGPLRGTTRATFHDPTGCLGGVAGLLLAAWGAGNDAAKEDAAASASPDAEQTQGGDTDDGGDTTGAEMDDMDDDIDMGDLDMGMSGAYGDSADASAADRTIEVMVDNELVFEPAEYEVAAGAVVTSGEMSNAVTIDPGEEAEPAWRFLDEAATVLVAGHYGAGMRGSVTVG